jgi:beta-lactamase class A
MEDPMLSRRHLAGAAAAALMTAIDRDVADASPSPPEALAARLAAIERESRGRLGVAVHDTGTGRRAAHRGDERFPMLSTFKLLLAAAVLAAVDAGRERLDRAVTVRRADLVTYSPVVERHVGGSISVAALCEATMTLSDNAAANLLLPIVGGPPGLTRFCRGLGDAISRLDRTEPDLNEAIPGDPRDTTTPDAMLASLDRIVRGDVLSPVSRARIAGWLVANRTGDARLRAGVPASWRVGDKTGTGPRGSANDIGILWPPGAAPLLVTSYLTGSALDGAGQSRVHAEVARAVVAAFGAAR